MVFCKSAKLIEFHQISQVCNIRHSHLKIAKLVHKVTLLKNKLQNQKGQNYMDRKYKLLTIRQASKLVEGLSEHHIRKLIKENHLPHIKSGNRVLIDEQEIYDYINIQQYTRGIEIE